MLVINQSPSATGVESHRYILQKHSYLFYKLFKDFSPISVNSIQQFNYCFRLMGKIKNGNFMFLIVKFFLDTNELWGFLLLKDSQPKLCVQFFNLCQRQALIFYSSTSFSIP